MDNLEKIVSQYRMIYDHHTHTTFSHGKGSIEDNVKVAVEKGLKSIAITDHGPGHLTYGIDRNKIKVMRDEIERLKLVYPQIEILLGVEANTLRVAPYIDLTEDEKKIIRARINGWSRVKMALELHMSVSTVDKLINRAMKKYDNCRKISETRG